MEFFQEKKLDRKMELLHIMHVRYSCSKPSMKMNGEEDCRRMTIYLQRYNSDIIVVVLRRRLKLNISVKI